MNRLGYPIKIGSGLIRRFQAPAGKSFLVTDENVAAAGWPDRLAADFTGRFILPAGEASKSMTMLESLLEAMIEAGLGRSDHIVAVGGGMVTDLAGFAAALLKRGCRWIAVPTSLLAQADSAIGGKTGINTRHGKNLIGAFHAPCLVLVDPQTLTTLPERELRSGYAEVVKYGLVGDPDFFGWCELQGEALLAGDEAARLRAIRYCVEAKTDYVAGDERDQSGRRALLNFGHSFGHAIEAETGMLHGEAVAIGMVIAFQRSVSLGLCPEGDMERVKAHLASVDLPVSTQVDQSALESRMKHDKKAGARILTRGIGKAFLSDEAGRPIAPQPDFG